MPRIRPRVVTAAEAELSRLRISTPPPRHLQPVSSPNLQPLAEQQDTYAAKVNSGKGKGERNASA